MDRWLPLTGRSLGRRRRSVVRAIMLALAVMPGCNALFGIDQLGYERGPAGTGGAGGAVTDGGQAGWGGTGSSGAQGGDGAEGGQTATGGDGGEGATGGLTGAGSPVCDLLHGGVHTSCDCGALGGTVVLQGEASVCQLGAPCPAAWSKHLELFAEVVCSAPALASTGGCGTSFGGSSCTAPGGWFASQPTCTYTTVTTATTAYDCIGLTAHPTYEACLDFLDGSDCTYCTCDYSPEADTYSWVYAGNFPCLKRNDTYHRICTYGVAYLTGVNAATPCAATAAGVVTCY